MDYVIVHGQLCSANELYHHGIKGMKWGVRRYQNKDGSLTSAGKKHRSLGEVVRDYRTNKKRKASLEKARQTKAANKKAAEERAEALKKGKIKAKDMTPDELRDRIARMELEKSYERLLDETGRGSAVRGRKYVTGILERSGENIATQLVTYTMGTAVNAAMNKAFGINDAVNPKKGQKDK